MQKAIITTAIIVVLIILGIIFFGWPKYQEFKGVRLEIKKNQLEVENKEKYFSELTSVLSKLKQYSSEFSKIDLALPATSTPPDLIKFFSEKVSQNGIILGGIDAGQIASSGKESKVQQITVNLSVVGFYPAFKNMLLSFYRSARLVEVESISFSAPSEGEIFSFGLRMKTYSY